MTRRSGAAKALVEQPGSGLPRAHGSPGRRGQFGHPARPSRRAHGPPHRPVPGAHLTSTTGRSRTAARRDAVKGGRLEQLTGWAGQVQCTGQQPGRFLAGGQVDATFQVADRPRAQSRRLRQLLLRQPRISPQPPQQPGAGSSATSPTALHRPNAIRRRYSPQNKAAAARTGPSHQAYKLARKPHPRFSWRRNPAGKPFSGARTRPAAGTGYTGVLISSEQGLCSPVPRQALSGDCRFPRNPVGLLWPGTCGASPSRWRQWRQPTKEQKRCPRPSVPGARTQPTLSRQ
jgi:hypothetical protein